MLTYTFGKTFICRIRAEHHPEMGENQFHYRWYCMYCNCDVVMRINDAGRMWVQMPTTCLDCRKSHKTLDWTFFRLPWEVTHEWDPLPLVALEFLHDSTSFLPEILDGYSSKSNTPYLDEFLASDVRPEDNSIRGVGDGEDSRPANADPGGDNPLHHRDGAELPPGDAPPPGDGSALQVHPGKT